jgi:hypothetical protein
LAEKQSKATYRPSNRSRTGWTELAEKLARRMKLDVAIYGRSRRSKVASLFDT